MGVGRGVRPGEGGWLWENADDAGAEGIRICAETIRAMSEVPGIDGVNIVAVGNLEAIPQAIEQSGVNS